MRFSIPVFGAVLCAAALLLDPKGLPAQEVLTLDDALSLALLQNAQLESAEISVEKVGDNIEALRAARYPALSAGFRGLHYFIDEEFTIEEGALGQVGGADVPAQDVDIDSFSGFTTQFSLSINQPLSDLSKIGLNIDRLEAKQDIAHQQSRATRQELARQVKQTYYEILSRQSAREAANASEAFYADLVEILQQKVEKRTALEFELLDAQARQAQAAHDGFSIESDLATDKEILNRLMGRALNAPFQVTEAVGTTRLDMDVEQAQVKALAQRPETQEARAQIKETQSELELKKTEYFPTVSLGAQYSKYGGTDFVPDEGLYVGLTAKWDFFNWGRTGDEVSSNARSVNQAKLDLRDAEERVQSDAGAKVRDLRKAIDLVPVTELAQKAAAEKLRVTTNRYREDAVLLDDLLEAESKLSKATDDLHQAKLGVLSARAALEKALGEE